MATLSYASDLGLGQPMAHCMRQTVVALRLAGLAGASGRELEATYYLGLMMNVYCHADAAEQARWFGDDISMKSDTFDLLDMSTARMVASLLRRVGSHGSGVARARRLAAFPVAGMKQVLSFATTHCTLGSQFAEQIGLDEAVCVAIRQGYEQWDGKGYPSHLRGEEICLPARLVQLAGPVEVVARRRGVEAAVAVARRHRGIQFDPAVVDLFCAHAPELLDGLDRGSDWDAILGTGLANLGTFGIVVCSAPVTVKPASWMESRVGRLQSQPTTNRLIPFMRSCERARWVSPERTCSRNRSWPPGRSTRRSSRSARGWSSTPHRTSVETATSKVASSKGRSSAGARSTVAPGACSPTLRSRRRSIGVSGSVRVSDSTAGP